MKKILLITEGLGSGGAERQFTGLAVFLKQKKFDVTVITYSDNMFYKSYLTTNNVSYIFCPQLLNKYARPYNLLKLYKSVQPEVVISFLQSVNLATCIAKIFSPRIKLIVSERNTNQTYSIKDRILFNLYHKADCIIPNSKSQESFILSHFPNYSHKTKVITNFVDTSYFTPSKIKLHSSIPQIVTVARYTTQKNCLRFLNAISLLKDNGVKVKFLWYGDIHHNPAYFSLLVDYIKDHELQDYIQLHDQTTQVLSVYHEADIFCLPSLYEGYPNVICEAMSCGLPILCSRVCDNPNIVQDSINGYLFDPYDVKDMVQQIYKMLNLTTEELLKMSANNRKIAVSSFSSAKFTEKYSKIISEI